MSKKSRFIMGIIMTMSLIGMCARFASFTTAHKSSTRPPATKHIRAAQVQRGSLIEETKISGNIKAQNEVNVFPKLPGRILKVYGELGDTVTEGKVLAVVEHEELKLQEKAAHASLLVAQANTDSADREFKRAQTLFSQQSIAKAHFEGAQLKQDMAKAQLKGAQAQLDLVKQHIKNAHISAPIAGKIITKNLNVGAMVSSEYPVYIVQDASTLRFESTVDAATLPKLKKGLNVSIFVDDNGHEYTGIIDNFSPSLDAQSRRAPVEIKINNSEGLLPNTYVYANVRFDTHENVLLVPNEALIKDESETKVFQIKKGEALATAVMVGYSDGHHSIVTNGLHEGDVVALSGLDSLISGSEVAVLEEASNNPATKNG